MMRDAFLGLFIYIHCKNNTMKIKLKLKVIVKWIWRIYISTMSAVYFAHFQFSVGWIVCLYKFIADDWILHCVLIAVRMRCDKNDANNSYFVVNFISAGSTSLSFHLFVLFILWNLLSSHDHYPYMDIYYNKMVRVAFYFIKFNK